MSSGSRCTWPASVILPVTASPVDVGSSVLGLLASSRVVKQAAFEQAQRRARVVHAWLAGDSARSIAADLKVSVGTVHRIINITPGVREERARRERDAHDQLSTACAEWSDDHLGETLAAGADTLGIGVVRLRQLLGARAALHPTPPSSSRRYTDEDLLERIREWMVVDGDKTAAAYQAAAVIHSWPTKATVIARFGTWTQALRAAGFDVAPGAGGTPKRWTDAELIEILAAYFAEDRTWSPGDLTIWLEAAPDRPSSALLRHRIGPWHALVQQTPAGRQELTPQP